MPELCFVQHNVYDHAGNKKNLQLLPEPTRNSSSDTAKALGISSETWGSNRWFTYLHCGHGDFYSSVYINKLLYLNQTSMMVAFLKLELRFTSLCVIHSVLNQSHVKIAQMELFSQRDVMKCQKLFEHPWRMCYDLFFRQVRQSPWPRYKGVTEQVGCTFFGARSQPGPSSISMWTAGIDTNAYHIYVIKMHGFHLEIESPQLRPIIFLKLTSKEGRQTAVCHKWPTNSNKKQKYVSNCLKEYWKKWKSAISTAWFALVLVYFFELYQPQATQMVWLMAM